MKKYDDIIKKINQDDDISDLDFIINQMIESNVFLFNEVEHLIKANKTTFVFPLLRQAYEYIILIISLYEGFLSLNDFIYPLTSKGDHKNIVEIGTKAILSHALMHDGKDKRDLINHFLRTIKKALNNHTHASFPRLLRFLLESYDKEKANSLVIRDAEYTYRLVEMFFIPIVNNRFNANYNSDEYKQALIDYPKLNQELIRDILPKKYERFSKISYVHDRLEVEGKKLKEDLDFYLENKEEISNYFTKQKN